MAENCYFKPFTKGSLISRQTKQIALNVYSKLKTINPKTPVDCIVNNTAELTGLSERTIYRIKSSAKLISPCPKSQSAKRKPTRREKYDSFIFSAIRLKVHSFYRRNEIPVICKVLKEVNEDNELPNYKLVTFRRILNDIGFIYCKRKRTNCLIERDDIKVWRRKYLKSIRQYRAEGRTIYYLGETWLNASDTKSNVWQDSTMTDSKNGLLEGLGMSTGLRTTSGKDGRCILVHAISESGFVSGTDLHFCANNSCGDYHKEMNGTYFEKWFKEKFLTNIQSNSVIILDDAPHHSLFVENIPTKIMRKADIQAWLTSKNLNWHPDQLKAELMEIVNSVKDQFSAFQIDRVAALAGHVVLRLPPYHFELNPIEMVWSQIKEFVATNNKSFMMAEVKKLIPEALATVSAENWSNYVSRVKEMEETFWEVDKIADDIIEKFVIQFPDEERESHSDLSGIEELIE